MSINLIDELYKVLRDSKKVVYFNTAKSELTTRCPYCGDSEDQSHAHLYIQTVSPFSFYCQRCNTKGYLGSRHLQDLSVDDSELGLSFDKTIKKTLRNTTKTGSGDSNDLISKKNTLLDYNVNSKRFNYKLDYLEERFGRSLDIGNLKDLKIVFDIIKFLQVNKCEKVLEYYSEYENRVQFMKNMNSGSVGFLSADTNYLNIRHIKPMAYRQGDIPRRYHMENLNRPLDLGNKVYYVGNSLDILTPTLNVIMTEGVFDIASVFLNIYDGLKNPNTIFVAANGKTFNLPILNLRRLGFLSINLDIYSDADVELHKYKYSLNRELFERINIHYNVKEGQKDFGVPLDKIKQKTYRLK